MSSIYADPSVDLVTLIEQCQTGQLSLSPTGHYRASRSVFIKRPIKLAGNGAAVSLSRAGNPANGSAANLIAQAAGCWFDNLHIVASDGVVFEPWMPKLVLTNVNILAPSYVNAVKTEPGASDLTLKNCTFGVSQSVTVYLTENNASIDNCTFAGAAGEYALRADQNDKRQKSRGLVMRNSRITNHNGAHKDAIGFRFFDQILVENCDVSGSIRFGQTPGAGAAPIADPTFCNADCVLRNVRLQASNAGVGNIMIHSGSTVLADACTWAAATNDLPPLTVDQGSILTVHDPIQLAAPPYRVVSVSSQGKYTVSHGGMVVLQSAN